MKSLNQSVKKKINLIDILFKNLKNIKRAKEKIKNIKSADEYLFKL